MSVEKPLLPGTDTEDPKLPIGTPITPYSTWIQFGNGWEVCARRPDGSVLTIIAGVVRSEAFRVRSRVDDAIRNSEEWVIRLIDVSAGKLRS